jgi:hypothetical protein
VKITRLGRSRPLVSITSGTTGTDTGSSGSVITSTGSNGETYWGPNVATITSNGSNTLTGPFVNVVSGSGVAFGAASNTLTISSTGVGGGTTVDPLNATGLVKFSGTLDSTINADQNDYNPSGLHTITTIRFTSFTANRTITGINAGTSGEILILVNNTGFSLLLPNESTSSSANNRFRSPNAATHTVRQQGSVLLIYLATRWCIVAA